MKRILFTMVLLVTTMAYSQEKTFEEEVSRISKKIEEVTKEEKDSLKARVKEINTKLNKKIITEETAEALKKDAATYHALQIEQRVGVLERELQQLVQDKTNGKIASKEEDEEEDFNGEVNSFKIGNKEFQFSVNEDENDDWSRKWERKRWRRNRRTTTQFIFALGLNNALENNQFASLNESPYEFWRSHFYELGFSFKTSLSKDASKLYFKYGLSFLWNNLRPEGGKYHEIVGDQTLISDYPLGLSENRLRHVQMNFPLHFELDFTPDRTYDDGFTRDRSGRGLRIGVGGFFGFKLGTRQYLEYNDANNLEIEELQRGDFNMNTVNYGLSTYIGHGDIALYVKYDLNPLFRDTETRNISMGVRFDFD